MTPGAELDVILDLIKKGKLGQAIKSMLVWVEFHRPDLMNQVIHQSSLYNKLEDDRIARLITFDENDLGRAQTTEALLALAEKCREKIEGKPLKTGLNDHHIYTCDRQTHTQYFKDINKKNSDKTHFFYLFGGDRQSHKGLFYRLAYELDGRLLDHVNPNYETSCKSVTVDFTCDSYDDMDTYKEEVVKSLFAAFDIPVNEQEPLLRKNLSDVFFQSPKVQNLKPNDYVCVLMIVGEYDWDDEKTPLVAEWFIEQFCSKELKEHFPSFYFFFGIEYNESNDEIKDQIGKALKIAQYIQPLPELDMVPFKDIGRWFGKYRKIEEDGDKRRKMIETHFDKGDRFYMVDVEEKLKRIIDQYNNKKLIK